MGLGRGGMDWHGVMRAHAMDGLGMDRGVHSCVMDDSVSSLELLFWGVERCMSEVLV